MSLGTASPRLGAATPAHERLHLDLPLLHVACSHVGDSPGPHLQLGVSTDRADEKTLELSAYLGSPMWAQRAHTDS